MIRTIAILRCVYRLREGTDTLNSRMASLVGRIKIGLEYALQGSGPLSMAPSQALMNLIDLACATFADWSDLI